MTQNNNVNSSNNINNINTKNSKKSENINYNNLIRDYILKRTESDIKFFDKNIDFFSDFKDFLSTINLIDSIQNEDKVKLLFQSKIDVNNLKIKNLFKKLDKLFEIDFYLDSNQKDELKDRLETKKYDFLKILLYSNSSRYDFLINDLWFKNINTKNDENKIKSILPKTFSFIEWKKEVISSIIYLVDARTKIDLEDLENILSILSIDQQKELVSYFFPVISLEEAIELWFLKQNDIEKKKKDILFSKSNLSLLDQESILKNIDNSEIYIETSDLNILRITPNIKNFLLKELNSHKKEYSNKANEINNYTFLDFLKFIEINKKFDSIIHNISNFKENNFLKISKKINSDKTEIHYYRIDEIISPNWLWTIKLTNINSLAWVNKNIKSFDREEIYTYSQFYDLFEKSVWKDVEYNFLSYSELTTDLPKENKADLKSSNEINTKEDFKNFLDDLDSKGKDISIDNFAFKFDIKWEDWKIKEQELYIVDKIDEVNKKIYLTTQEVFDFDVFLQLFSQVKAKRINKVSSPKEFVEQMSSKNEWFKDLVFKDKKIIPKSKEQDEKFKSIQYFIWKDPKESIYIKKMWDNTVDFIIWEYIEWKDWKDKFKWDKKWTWWTYTEFFDFIKEKNLTPKIFDLDTNNHEEKVKDVSWQKTSLISFYMWNFVSINQIILWLTKTLDTVKTRLEHWDKLKSYKLALQFWKFLPESVRDELQSMVEREEKSTMEELRENLTTLDSAVMMPRIEKILLNKNSSIPELERAVFAALKYGTIYPKSLKKYRWTYAWFKAMWWKTQDIAYYTSQLKEDDSNLVVTEELIIYRLLWDQAKWKHPPKRRSKIHKEFAKAVWVWVNDELGDWEEETWKKMTQDWRINYVIGELKNWTFYNWLWWMEKIWTKWPDPRHKMFTIPFVVLASKMTMYLTQDVINKLAWYGYSTAHTAMSICSSDSKLEMYKSYVAKVIELKFWKSWSMHKKFLSIKDVDSASSFWKEFWLELYPYINMNNWFVLSRKDEPWNEALLNYYNHIKWVHSSDDFKNAKISDDIEWWVFDFENSPIFASESLLEKVSARDRWYIDKSTSKILKMYTDFINSIKDDEDILNEEKRKDLFKKYYSLVERTVYDKLSPHKSDNQIKWWYKNFEIARALEENWVEIYDWSNWKDYQDFLEQKYNSFISSNMYSDILDDVNTYTPKKIEEILSWNFSR